MFYFSNSFRSIVASGLFAAVVSVSGGQVNAKAVSPEVVLNAVTAAEELPAGAKSFYSQSNYKPIWVGSRNRSRTKALMSALRSSATHGLPTSRYKIGALDAALKSARRGRDAGVAEVMATTAFLAYAHDIGSGIVAPTRIDKNISLSRPRRADAALLNAMSKSSGSRFLASLAPKNPEYKRLLGEKKRLERKVGLGGYGAKVPVRTLKPGRSNKNVIALRGRLERLGYGKLGDSAAYDEGLVAAVKRFQVDHGLTPDGVAGKGTIQVANVSATGRLQQVIVSLERERWLNLDRGKRHILINIADFSFSLYDNDKVSFKSDVIVGAFKRDRITPEFNDEMAYIVVNPVWNVPPSIAGKEYLPMLQKDPTALARRGLKLLSRSGKAVNVDEVDFSEFTAKKFPFSIKQPPGYRNALGRVKFIFPNKFNIYMHDTPTKSLFKREVRTFSHGCIRVQRPLEFAYKLLEKQTSNPEGAFAAWEKTKREQYVNLETPVPVFVSYRTAFFAADGRINFRRDIYKRDKKIFAALSKAGVVLQALQG